MKIEMNETERKVRIEEFWNLVFLLYNEMEIST